MIFDGLYSDYSDFYSAIASSILVLTSVLVALAIYLWQQHDSTNRKLDNELQELTELIKRFTDINYDARDIPPHQSLDLELNNLKKKALNHYNNCNKANWNDNDDYKQFLWALKSLQHYIYKNIMFNFEVLGHGIQNKWDFKWFMDRICPRLDDADRALTYLGGLGSIDTHKEHHANLWNGIYRDEDDKKYAHEFFFHYWDTLLEIRSKSKDIDDLIWDCEQKNKLGPVLETPRSIQLIKISLLFISIFGVIIPLYMIQPIKLGHLCSDTVFYLVVFFILLSILLGIMAYGMKHKYRTEKISQIIEDLRNHKDKIKRERAAEELGQSGNNISIKPLEEAIKNDTSRSVQLAAMCALIKLGKTRQTLVNMEWFPEKMESLLEGIDSLIKKTKTLIWGPEYFDQIVEDLKAEDKHVRSTALNVLGDIDDPRAVGFIKSRLEIETDRAVRLSAIFALVKIGDSEAVKYLQQIANDDNESELVREKAGYILRAYGMQ